MRMTDISGIASVETWFVSPRASSRYPQAEACHFVASSFPGRTTPPGHAGRRRGKKLRQ